MSRIIASSVTVDLVGRFFNLALFALLLPMAWVLSRRAGIEKVMPDGKRWPDSAQR